MLSAATNGAETGPGGPAAVVPFPVAWLKSRAVARGISKNTRTQGDRTDPGSGFATIVTDGQGTWWKKDFRAILL